MEDQTSVLPGAGLHHVSSRPVPPARAISELPMRLTPITGRVSKAKKGVPVHVCDIRKPAEVWFNWILKRECARFDRGLATGLRFREGHPQSLNFFPSCPQDI